ncbi:MAG: ParA family protein [Planctomycetes bacterium]|nr:ParA family protein [Planctomycetota bacterium]
MKSFVLFNNKDGVGKTTLTYHFAHMLARLGHRTVVLDYDPQCNITAMFVDDETLEPWIRNRGSRRHVTGCLDLVRRGKGDVAEPELTTVADNLWILAGDLDLSLFEEPLAEAWPKKLSQGNERALDVLTALDLLSDLAAATVDADFVLVDVGPSLGALNRSALLACDSVVLPLAPDLFSLQGISNVGPALRSWRAEWHLVRERFMAGRAQASLTPHEFRPVGYLVQQHLARADRPVTGYAAWAKQIPSTYRLAMEGADALRSRRVDEVTDIDADPNCIGTIKHFASLVPIAQQARKPIFDLKQADGIGGGQALAVQQSRTLFEGLTRKLIERLERIPPPPVVD